MRRPSRNRSSVSIAHALWWQARAQLFVTTTALLVLVSLLFIAWPSLDLAVSGLFFDPAEGFGARHSVIQGAVREFGNIAVWAVALALAVPPLIKVLAPDSRLLVTPRASLFGLGGLILGPGLIVNGIFKEFWGRARPREITEFGGDAMFSQAWAISDQCARNCSFVSGEASSAFWLVSLTFVVPRHWRTTILSAALVIAVAVSFTRLAYGAHFLSDVLIAWLLTLLVLVILEKFVLQGRPPAFDGAVEAALARQGRRLRRWWAGA